jgi:hypothetical protein
MERDTLMLLVGSLIGFLANVCVALAIEYYRRPKLKISLLPQEVQTHGDSLPARVARFLHVSVKNCPSRYLSFWMERNTAVGCTVALEFISIDGKNPFGSERRLGGRWVSSPEFGPIPITASPIFAAALCKLAGANEIPPVSLLHVADSHPVYDRLRQQRVDIGAGDEEAVTIAARFDDDEDSFAFTNASYFSEPQWRNPQLHLGRGIFFVRVEVRSSGMPPTVKAFRIQNDGPPETFRLFEVDVNDFEIRKGIANGTFLKRPTCRCGCE